MAGPTASEKTCLRGRSEAVYLQLQYRGEWEWIGSSFVERAEHLPTIKISSESARSPPHVPHTCARPRESHTDDTRDRLFARAAVDAPRMDHEWFPERVRLIGADQERFADLTRALRTLGHDVQASRYQGDANTILVDANGTRHGAADSQHGAAAIGK